MSIVERAFFLLVRDDAGGPCFAPAGFFEIFDAGVPQGWRFALGAGVHASGRALWSAPTVATWGYRELIDDAFHLQALLEFEPAALTIFDRYVDAAEAAGT
ncbi:MAG: hypothetical protein WAV45_09450 [Propionibacteriaceae bacterium]|nr:hypothetical protein [Micropruina sp.]HBX81965.1 hypothetical protein [Propionibacteriaceae bacterium]HBY23880.1 hypothetical protein [Propionibacteriaceae bacterium]